jgi:prephenate dehydratase
MIKVAFQGERGAFSEDAAFHFWGRQILPKPQKTFRHIFQAVRSRECEYGILPIENSFTGSIHQNIDLLLEFDLSITGELILRIRHHLLGLKDANLDQIERVYSHPQALEQCSLFLDKLPQTECTPMYDTAGSAKFIASENNRALAAIATNRAGKEYHLKVLKKEIENNPFNYTRFLVISREQDKLQKGSKTSIVFSTKDIPGALFKSLSVFALRDINLLKIESRPLRKGDWKYYFYLDFEGNVQDEACSNAINHLKEITQFLKVLGSYPTGRVVE